MARFVFCVPVENRLDGIDFGFVTGEDVVSNTATEVIGRFDSTIFGEVRLTVVGEGLRLGDGASDFCSAGVLTSAISSRAALDRTARSAAAGQIAYLEATAPIYWTEGVAPTS